MIIAAVNATWMIVLLMDHAPKSAERGSMFSTEASTRLKELQSKPLLTRGEEIEVRHLIELKYKYPPKPQLGSSGPYAGTVSTGTVGDMAALQRAAQEALDERRLMEYRQKLQGQ